MSHKANEDEQDFRSFDQRTGTFMLFNLMLIYLLGIHCIHLRGLNSESFFLVNQYFCYHSDRECLSVYTRFWHLTCIFGAPILNSCMCFSRQQLNRCVLLKWSLIKMIQSLKLKLNRYVSGKGYCHFCNLFLLCLKR